MQNRVDLTLTLVIGGHEKF